MITNGTAVLGLGAIGPLAAKPVMEGKAVLFKKFADIDAFDLEIDERDPDKLVEIIASLEPTFGAINLEDIKAPECFEVEAKLRARMRIPVFHDDQHGTAIIVAAAMLNGLHLVGKVLDEIRLVTCGAGAAALACLDLLVALGLKREHVLVVDIEGVVYAGRTTLMDPYKARYAQTTAKRTLAEAIEGADVFLGLSAPNVCHQAMVEDHGRAAADPGARQSGPGDRSGEARAARPDAIIATGRSDFPNQVNNVIGFPFIFRGALDVGATTINEPMKIACAQAIARLARTTRAGDRRRGLRPERPRLRPGLHHPQAVRPEACGRGADRGREAAMASGVATRPIADFKAYRERSDPVRVPLRPDHEADLRAGARAAAARRVRRRRGAEGAARGAGAARGGPGAADPDRPPGRGASAHRAPRSRPCRSERGVELCNPESDPRYDDYVAHYLKRMGRHGVTPDAAREIVRTRTTVIGAIMVDRGEADALIAGPTGRFQSHLRQIHRGARSASGRRRTPRPSISSSSSAGSLFIADTYVSVDLPAEAMAETMLMAAEMVRRFGITPKVALLSHSNFGSLDSRRARARCGAPWPDPGAGAGARDRRRDARRCGALGGDPRPHPARTRR